MAASFNKGKCLDYKYYYNYDSSESETKHLFYFGYCEVSDKESCSNSKKTCHQIMFRAYLKPIFSSVGFLTNAMVTSVVVHTIHDSLQIQIIKLLENFDP